MATMEGAPARWPAVLSLLLLLLGGAFALWPLWAILHDQWTSVSLYSHGYLLLAMTLWLAYGAWSRVPDRVLEPGWPWAVPLLAVAAGLALMEVLFLNVPRVYVLPFLLLACAGLVFGNPVARKMFWPAMFLFLALPVWVDLQPPLQSLTTFVVSAALRATRIPAYIEGNFVYLPSGTFEIAAGCSGLNYLMVGMTLGMFCALAFLHSWRRQLLLFSTAVALTIFCNWLRVYIIIVVGHVSEMQHYLVAESHILFGWVLFGVFLIPVLWLARRLQDHPAEAASSARRTLGPVNARPAVIPAVLVALVILLIPRVLVLATADPGHAGELPPTDIRAAGFEAGVRSPWQPHYADALETRTIFADAPVPLEVYRAVYPWQTSEARLIRYGQTATGPGWRPVAVRGVTLSLADQTWTAIEREGYFGQRRYLVVHWYWVAGDPASDSIGAKLQELRGLLRGRRDAQVIAIAAECGMDCSATRAHLQDFVHNYGERLRWQP